MFSQSVFGLSVATKKAKDRQVGVDVGRKVKMICNCKLDMDVVVREQVLCQPVVKSMPSFINVEEVTS